MTSFLSNIIGNPFATQIGQAIERASNVTESFENWALYMEICDMINNSDDGPRDAIKAFKKLIATNEGKNDIILNQTLTVLETCVKNCGHRFHVQIANRDFLQEIVKLLTTKVMPSQILVDRMLGLLQTWADAFQGVNGLEEVSKVNKELKEKGFEFPVVDVERAPPIHTPARKTNITVDPTTLQKPHHVSATAPSAAPQLTEDISLNNGFYISASQMAKLKSELDVVIQNCKVFNELLNENTPGQEADEDWKLMEELNATCKEFHRRLVELVRRYTIENLTSDILPVNDEVTNVMLRFERYERLKKGSSNTEAATSDESQNLVCLLSNYFVDIFIF
ncbi:hypothetical protein HELRODRAFT_109399 [Helobdella robusta]|uniref:VHS domain-containing protein n=1 Tax=Helobdella robusta TaxID=6412 RepID=T1EET3_HELRO|nr:hypothetical protein HELRODRAFT_109399 [Helobdella robusta]ESO10033.1 hypothetical protein HELRODRAFT_109399 [Helobdella robusta]